MQNCKEFKHQSRIEKFKLCLPYGLVNPFAVLTLRWHFDFCTAKIGMPQKGLGILLRPRLRRTRKGWSLRRGKRGLLQNLHTENAF